jgi:hypothetical protein
LLLARRIVFSDRRASIVRALDTPSDHLRHGDDPTPMTPRRQILVSHSHSRDL